MMPLIKYEFIKMRGRKSFIVILILLLLSQFFLFSVSLNQKIPLSAYQKFHQTLLSLPNEKRYEFTKKEYEKYQSFMILEQLTQLRQNEQKMLQLSKNFYKRILMLKIINKSISVIISLNIHRL